MKHLNGILISSGFSSRMGDFKPLLSYQDVPFFINILSKLLQVCESVNLVLGYKKDELIDVFEDYKKDKDLLSEFSKKIKLDLSFVEFDRVNIIYNPNFENGMFTSLKAGLKETKTNHIIYHFVDQPHIPFEFYKKFVNQDSQGGDWFQPQFRDRKGHPIIFNEKVKNIILRASDNSNLRDELIDKDISKNYWDCDYPQILDDIDTPKDYQGLC